jgi:hypothetical protein
MPGACGDLDDGTSAPAIEHVQAASPATTDVFRGLHRPAVARPPIESSRTKIGFRITPRMVLPSSARWKKSESAAYAPVSAELHITTSATAFLPRSMRVGHGIGAYACTSGVPTGAGAGSHATQSTHAGPYRDEQFEADRDHYLETLRGIRLLQRYVRRRRWRLLFGAKHIPLIHGGCGLTAWPIFVRNQLEGMEGPSGQLYRGTSLGCLSIRSPVRVGAIFLVEWPWFDRMSLLAVMANCLLLALQGPPDSYSYLPSEAALREVELAFCFIFTAELMAVSQPASQQASKPASQQASKRAATSAH